MQRGKDSRLHAEANRRHTPERSNAEPYRSDTIERATAFGNSVTCEVHEVRLAVVSDEEATAYRKRFTGTQSQSLGEYVDYA
ncbi:hypothetical protein GCM10027456_81820 [Kineosporia babensis]